MSRKQDYFTFKNVKRDKIFTAGLVLNVLNQSKRQPDYIRYRRSNNQLTSRDYTFGTVAFVNDDIFVINRPVGRSTRSKGRFQVAKELNAMNLIVYGST